MFKFPLLFSKACLVFVFSWDRNMNESDNLIIYGIICYKGIKKDIVFYFNYLIYAYRFDWSLE